MCRKHPRPICPCGEVDGWSTLCFHRGFPGQCLINQPGYGAHAIIFSGPAPTTAAYIVPFLSYIASPLLSCASHPTLVLRPTAFGTSIRCVFLNWHLDVKIGDNVQENIVAYKQRTWWGGARISYVAKHTWNFASARRPHSRFYQLHRPHIRPYFLQLPTVAFFVANGNRSRVPQLALGMRFSHVTDAYVS